MKVAVISLRPLDGSDPQGERLTLHTVQSIRAVGDRCEAFAVRDLSSTAFLNTLENGAPGELELPELLQLIPRFDVVWVHSYGASALLAPILRWVSPEQQVLFTNCGSDPSPEIFGRAGRLPANYSFIEPDARLASNAKIPGTRVDIVSANAWADSIGRENRGEKRQLWDDYWPRVQKIANVARPGRKPSMLLARTIHERHLAPAHAL